MRVTQNLGALNAWRHYSGTVMHMEKVQERLASGRRINRASDDVAGLAISERMQGQIRGLRQALRNIDDGISVVRVAESALGEATALLQRGRELALQASNGVLTPEDRSYLQTETEHLLDEIDRIVAHTEFNEFKLLGGGDPRVTDMVNSLRRSWLDNAEEMVETYYGLTGDAVPIKIVAEETGTNPAWVTGSDDGTGKLTNLELHINLSMMENLILPNGGSAPQYADRIIAHEITHAVMARSMDFASLPKWFVEGAAELIAGGAERVAADLAAAGGNWATLLNELDTWEGSSADYSAGYLAMLYLHRNWTGPAEGVQRLMSELQGGATLDAAIAAATGGAHASEGAFLTQVKAAAGAYFTANGVGLPGYEAGSIAPGNAETVVPDTDTNTWDPLENFQEVWPDETFRKAPEISLQVGPNGGPSQQIRLPELYSGVVLLGLADVDLVNNADKAIKAYDSALRSVTTMRSELGAIENRLEHSREATAVQIENLTASESRIRDTDMAWEMSRFVRQQITLQAGVAMLAQAHSLHRTAIMGLLG